MLKLNVKITIWLLVLGWILPLRSFGSTFSFVCFFGEVLHCEIELLILNLIWELELYLLDDVAVCSFSKGALGLIEVMCLV